MRTLHVISHTHWDREWYLTFQQFRLKLVRLIDRLLDLLAADPAYLHFTLDGQMIILAEFLVSPEATIRNLLEGDRSSRRFGPKMLVGYSPDSFGHIGQLPQILAGF